MKMAKKFLAVALAGVLALSVLTGCGNSVKSKDIADSLTKMGVKVEQSKDVDKTAENTLKAIETIIAADSANKITLDNAVEKVTGKVTNSTKATTDYVITVSWVNDTSDVLARGVSVVEGLEGHAIGSGRPGGRSIPGGQLDPKNGTGAGSRGARPRV